MIRSSEYLDAENVIRNARRDLAEAQKFGIGALAVLLQKRIDEWAGIVATADSAFEALARAEAAEQAAVAEHDRAARAHGAGSLDRSEALRLRDDLECARQTLGIRKSEAAAARSLAIAPLGAVVKHRRDPHRERASLVVEAVVASSLAGRVADGIDQTPDPEAALWEQLFAARELALYTKRIGRTHPFARPVEQLAALFASRARSIEHRRARLESELRAIEDVAS
jgi:hypothetical protein